MTTKTRLVLEDLERTFNDERHLGWGYFTSTNLSHTVRARLDCRVIDVANELGLDYENLFLWSNSKYGRWLVDDIGSIRDCTFKTVRRHLHTAALERLHREEGS